MNGQVFWVNCDTLQYKSQYECIPQGVLNDRVLSTPCFNWHQVSTQDLIPEIFTDPKLVQIKQLIEMSNMFNLTSYNPFILRV